MSNTSRNLMVEILTERFGNVILLKTEEVVHDFHPSGKYLLKHISIINCLPRFIYAIIHS